MTDEADGPGYGLAGGESPGGVRAGRQALHIRLRDVPDEQHRVQIDDAGARGARLSVVAHLQARLFHDAGERRPNVDPFRIQHRGLQLRLGGGQPRLGLGDGCFRLEAAILQPQAAAVLDLRLVRRGLRLDDAGLAVFRRKAAEQIAGGYAVAALDRPRDHAAHRLRPHLHRALVLRSTAHSDALGKRNGIHRAGANGIGRTVVAADLGVSLGDRRMVANTVASAEVARAKP